MHDTTRLALARLHRFRPEQLGAGPCRSAMPLTVAAWEAPDEPVRFAEAVPQQWAPRHRAESGQPDSTSSPKAGGTHRMTEVM